MMRELDVYPYKEMPGSVKSSLLFSEIKDYELTVPCLNQEVITYIYRSYCYNDYLYITDIFPAMWDGLDDCFKRITSREGYTVNMRKLSVTCLYIFVKHYISAHKDNAMVISGSYEYGEDESHISRKLRLYRAFFFPLLDQLSLRVVPIWELNAFVLTDRKSKIEDEIIVNDYRNFKSSQK